MSIMMTRPRAGLTATRRLILGNFKLRHYPPGVVLDDDEEGRVIGVELL
jgi:hypothetical protein